MLAVALPQARLELRRRRQLDDTRLTVDALGRRHGDAIEARQLAKRLADDGLPEPPRPGACTTGPSQPLPILILHGTADTQMPWEGGCVANVGGACNRGRVVSAQATRDRWLQIDGLFAATPASEVVEIDTADSGPAHRFDYAGDTPLQWWRLDGAGHSVASRIVLIEPNPLTGIQNRDIEFAEVAWEFFAAR